VSRMRVAGTAYTVEDIGPFLPFDSESSTITMAPCFVRVVEVRLFKTGRLFDRVPVDRRRWEPCGDLPKTAREISDFITDGGSAEATIVASDEL
jgi:hypothetical protein